MDWLYIGGHVGGLWSSDDNVSVEKQKCRYYYCKEWMPAEYVDFSKHDDDTSFIGGVHAGYNFQIDRTVLGFEGDIDFADSIDYLASLRARLGYASGNFLITRRPVSLLPGSTTAQSASRRPISLTRFAATATTARSASWPAAASNTYTASMELGVEESLLPVLRRREPLEHHRIRLLQIHELRCQAGAGQRPLDRPRPADLPLRGYGKRRSA